MASRFGVRLAGTASPLMSASSKGLPALSSSSPSPPRPCKKRKTNHASDDETSSHCASATCKKSAASTGVACAICHRDEDEIDKDQRTELQPCNHAYCTPCIVTWLKKNKKCPLCNVEPTNRAAILAANNERDQSEDRDEEISRRVRRQLFLASPFFRPTPELMFIIREFFESRVADGENNSSSISVVIRRRRPP